MWWSIGCVAVLLVLNAVASFFAPIVKGKRGEKQVLKVLKSLPEQEYQQLYADIMNLSFYARF